MTADGRVRWEYIIPHPRNLTPEEQRESETGGLPITIRVRQNDLEAYHGCIQKGGLAEEVGRCLREQLPRVAQELTRLATNPRPPKAIQGLATPLSDDAFIDQRSGLVDKAIFLRLARELAFPSYKIGKRILARWGDVRQAIESRQRTIIGATGDQAEPTLDVLRKQMGLLPRGQ